MSRSRHTEAQMIGALKQVEAGRDLLPFSRIRMLNTSGIIWMAEEAPARRTEDGVPESAARSAGATRTATKTGAPRTVQLRGRPNIDERRLIYVGAFTKAKETLEL